MDQGTFIENLSALAAEQEKLSQTASSLVDRAAELFAQTPDAVATHGGFFLTGLTVFVLACFVGYYVVWRVTPALHSPLMAVTNAVSSVIVVGALMAAGLEELAASSWLGLAAVLMASINIFGGFIVTQRMLSMFRKKGS